MNKQAMGEQEEREFDLDGYMDKRKSSYWLWFAGIVIIGLAVWFIPGNEANEDIIAIDNQLEIAGFTAGEAEEITLYLPDVNQAGLLVVPRMVELGRGPEERIERVIASLIKHDSEGYGILPMELIIRDIFISGATAVVSIDGSLKRRFRGGAWTELIIAYSLINTIIENFDSIDFVKILVDDKDADFFASHVSASTPFTSDLSLVTVPTGAERESGVATESIEEIGGISDDVIENEGVDESDLSFPGANGGLEEESPTEETEVIEEKIKL